jgi:hypothetical protein
MRKRRPSRRGCLGGARGNGLQPLALSVASGSWPNPREPITSSVKGGRSSRFRQVYREDETGKIRNLLELSWHYATNTAAPWMRTRRRPIRRRQSRLPDARVPPQAILTLVGSDAETASCQAWRGGCTTSFAPCRQQQEKEPDHYGEAQGGAEGRPLSALDTELARTDDVGNVARDEHAAGDQKTAEQCPDRLS